MTAPVVNKTETTHASGASRAPLDGGRWHFQHGPIDLIIGVDGPGHVVVEALEHVWQQFHGLLPALVSELPLLRQPASQRTQSGGPVARRMVLACQPHLPAFITPMAAVAGSVADELIAVFSNHPGIERAYINNGGDIALYLTPDTIYRVGLFADVAQYHGDNTELDGHFIIDARMPVRGIATSGWRGRSFSLGIADSVTVFSVDAATADAAATMIGNAVDAEHPEIIRAPALSLKDDSDLGDMHVTVQVGALPRVLIDEALERGARHAKKLVDGGVIFGAAMVLQGQVRLIGLN